MNTLKHLVPIWNSRKNSNDKNRRLVRRSGRDLLNSIRRKHPVIYTMYEVNGKLSDKKPKNSKYKVKTKKSSTYSYDEFKDQYTIIPKSDADNGDSTNSSAATSNGIDWKASYDSVATEISSASSAQVNLKAQLNNANNKLNDVEAKVPTTNWKIKYDSLANEQNNQLAIAQSKASSNSTNAYNLTKACQSKDGVINSLKANPANNNNELMKSQNDKLSNDNTILSETLNTDERIIRDITKEANDVLTDKKNPDPKGLAAGIKSVIDLNRKMEKSTKQINNQDSLNNPDK